MNTAAQRWRPTWAVATGVECSLPLAAARRRSQGMNTWAHQLAPDRARDLLKRCSFPGPGQLLQPVLMNTVGVHPLAGVPAHHRAVVNDVALDGEAALKVNPFLI